MGYIVSSPYTDRVVAVLRACRDSLVTPVLRGEPGTGKTELIQSLATAEAGRPYLLRKVLASSMDPTDPVGMPVRVERPDGTWTTKYAAPEWALDCIEADRAILFFDELNNGTPAVQSALLTLLQSRHLPMGPAVPDGVWMIAAINPEDMAADGWAFSPPMANRLCHIDWDPPVDDWFRGAIVSWGRPVPDAEAGWRGLVISFLRVKPQLLHAVPADATAAGHAWPSRRSWDNAIRALGRLTVRDDPTVLACLSGFVGEAAAVDFVGWMKDFDLPDPLAVLADPTVVDWANERTDKAFAILGAVMARGMSDQAQKVVDVFVRSATDGPADLGAGLVQDLLANWPAGEDFPIRLVSPFQEVLKAAGLV